jgi:redox-sensitive bicupin YhaK (pirin superfamily)
MGPAELAPGAGIDVRPHPHIGLATVTYLFAGSIVHRDSLGSVQAIEPGAVNWMTAGRGIVHSERTSDAGSPPGAELFGIQTWVALPTTHEETERVCTMRVELPEIDGEGVWSRIILGTCFGRRSRWLPMPILCTPIASLTQELRVSLPAEIEERAVSIVSGELQAGNQALRSRDAGSVHAQGRSCF